MYPNLCANTYHDVTNFELDGMALDIKIWKSTKKKKFKKILKFCLKDHCFITYHFLVDAPSFRNQSVNFLYQSTDWYP